MTRRPLGRIAHGAALVGLLAAAATLASFCAKVKPSRAADHQDTPTTSARARVDIADLFAFMRPEARGAGGYAPSGHLVAIMTVNPGGAPSEGFDPLVTYRFSFASAGATDKGEVAPFPYYATVDCKFQPPADAGAQPYVCLANGNYFASTTGVISGSETSPLRVYAGLRADPAFGDLQQMKQTVDTGVLKIAPGGTNSFQGKNVQAIVVDIDVNRIIFTDSPATRPILAVAASVELE